MDIDKLRRIVAEGGHDQTMRCEAMKAIAGHARDGHTVEAIMAVVDLRAKLDRANVEWGRETARLMSADERIAALRAERDALRAALEKVRRKVHAHNRGGYISETVRDEVRDICDAALRPGSE